MHGPVRLDTAPVVVNEIAIVGSRCGRFEPALALLQSRKINVVDMISETMPLAEGMHAFARAARPGVLKVLIK
jgi:alcohol dehydrogenase